MISLLDRASGIPKACCAQTDLARLFFLRQTTGRAFLTHHRALPEEAAPRNREGDSHVAPEFAFCRIVLHGRDRSPVPDRAPGRRTLRLTGRGPGPAGACVDV